MFFVHSNINPRTDVEIWRRAGETKRNAWGDYDETLPEPPVPALYGRKYVRTIYGAVLEPRTTRVESKPEYNEKMTFTGITLFVSADEEVLPDDFLAFTNQVGVYEVFRVEGEAGTNLYVSPHSGIIGGKEVFAARYRGAKE